MIMLDKETKTIALITLVIFVIFIAFNFQSIKNSFARRGGIAESSSDYLIINYSGSEIMDVWILEDVFVNNNKETDGVEFKTPNGKSIIIQGDCKIERLNKVEGIDQYVEYHKELHGSTYEEYKKGILDEK